MLNTDPTFQNASTSGPLDDTISTRFQGEEGNVALSTPKRVNGGCHHACRICGKTTGHLSRHEPTHPGRRPYPCPLDSCGRRLSRRSNVRRHLRNVHGWNPEAIGQLTITEVTYPRLVIRIPPLSRFNAKVTLPIPPLHPSQCESVFPNDINPSREEVAPPVANTADTLKLREDLLTTPLSPLSSRSPSPPPSPTPKLPETTDSPLHQCSLCSKTFLRASALERHRRIHTGERPFVCEHCKYAFQQRYHLKRHLKTVHRRPPRVSNTRSTLTTLIPSETSVERGASPATIYSSPSPPPASNSPINDDPLDLPLPVAQLEVPPTPAASDPSMLPPELEVLSKSVVLDPPPPALSRKRQPIFMRRPETVLLPPRYCDLLQRKMAFHLAAMFPDRPPS